MTYVEANATLRYFKILEGEPLIAVVLEIGQLLLYALALDLMLEELMMLNSHCQLVQTHKIHQHSIRL